MTNQPNPPPTLTNPQPQPPRITPKPAKQATTIQPTRKPSPQNTKQTNLNTPNNNPPSTNQINPPPTLTIPQPQPDTKNEKTNNIPRKPAPNTQAPEINQPELPLIKPTRFNHPATKKNYQPKPKPVGKPPELDKNTKNEKYQTIRNFFKKMDEKTKPNNQEQPPYEQIPPKNEPPTNPQTPPKPIQIKLAEPKLTLTRNQDKQTNTETKTKPKPELKPELNKNKKKKPDKPPDIKSFLALKKLELLERKKENKPPNPGLNLEPNNFPYDGASVPHTPTFCNSASASPHSS